ncbi:hypothetical protein [Arthrobacter sp. KNU40]
MRSTVVGQPSGLNAAHNIASTDECVSESDSYTFAKQFIRLYLGLFG